MLLTISSKQFQQLHLPAGKRVLAAPYDSLPFPPYSRHSVLGLNSVPLCTSTFIVPSLENHRIGSHSV